jgi:ABC-2 type transport system permease protein
MTQATLQSKLSVMKATTRMRLITISRYPGQLITDIIIPIVFAAMPILLGRATAGADAGAVFAENTGTDNFVGFMLIGAAAFTIVSYSFWHIANWLRWEMETGTLEALYLTPTDRIWIAAGIAVYSGARSIASALIAYLLGSLIFGTNPFQGELLLALLFVIVGLLPLYGVTLLFGAVVLKLKEANALINLMQWGVSFFMGVFFPVAAFPPLLRFLALLFPPTWMTNGVRASLLGIGYFFGEWYLDLAMMWVFILIAPLIGYRIFQRVETGIRRNEGVGQF